MNKLTYWLRKSGMLRTSSYTVKGDMEKLNEVTANDGGRVQSQKEINQQYKESQNQSNNNNQPNNQTSQQNDNQNKKGSSSKALFWIFLISGILIFLFMFVIDAIMASFVFLALWIWFLMSIWKKANQGILLIGQTIGVGIAFLTVAFIISIIIISSEDSVDENKSVEETVQIKEDIKEVAQDEQKKDDAKAVVKKDKISQFFADLEKETGVDFGQEKMAKVVWTNGGAGLGLQDAKEIVASDTSSKDFKTIQKYFESNGGTHGTVGMVFKGESNQDGYYFQDGEYKMLMCVLTDTQKTIKVSCGWGPGGNK